MRNGNIKEHKRIEAAVEVIFKDQPADYNAPMWYAYCWDETINYSNALDADTVKRLANKLIAMSKEMRTSLGINP